MPRLENSHHWCEKSPALGVRGYCNDRYLVFIRSAIPENSVGGRRRLLGIGFEDLFSPGPGEAGELMGLKVFVSWVLRQKVDLSPLRKSSKKAEKACY